jgi:replicative DNA helicase
VLSAEEAVIAACLLEDDAYARVCTIVSSGDFRSPELREMFDAIAYLARHNTLVTAITLGHELAQRNELDRVGGEPAIQEVIGRWFTATGVEAHARIVKADSLSSRPTASAGSV